MGVIMDTPPAPIRGSTEVEEESDLVAVFALLPVLVSVASDSVLMAELLAVPVAEAVSAVVAASPVVADSAAMISIQISCDSQNTGDGTYRLVLPRFHEPDFLHTTRPSFPAKVCIAQRKKQETSY